MINVSNLCFMYLFKFGGIGILICDSRETKCNKLLKDKKANIDVEFLDVGDVLLPKSFAVERKTGRDLLNSISDKRMYKQLGNLYQYDYPILAVILEDIWEELYYARNPRNQNIHKVYEGTLNTITSKFPKVRILFFKNDDIYTDWLIDIDKRLTEEGNGCRPTPVTRKPTKVQDIRENVLAAIPGIGISMAKKLLKHYGTVRNVANAKPKDLEKINKLGKKTSEKIIEVFN